MDDMKSHLKKGLTSLPKYIPIWYMYDKIGSELHEKCTAENKKYYFLRGQIDILQKHTKDMVVRMPYEFTLADLGCGNCSKTKYFLDELLKQQSHVKFYPLDISKEFLTNTVDNLSKEYGEKLTIVPIAKDYDGGLEELGRDKSPMIIVWFGSIISLAYEDQVTKLKKIAAVLSERCYLIFSVDITQDRDAILKAYTDGPGLLNEFWLNGVRRLNREEGSDFDLDKFHQKADFVKSATPDNTSYFLSYLQAKDVMDVNIPGLKLNLQLQKDECIYLADGPRSGSSYKYTREQICCLTRRAGLFLTDSWTDKENRVMFCKCLIGDYR